MTFVLFSDETCHLISEDILVFVRRAYTYQLSEYSIIDERLPVCFESLEDSTHPLFMDKLVSLYDKFVELFVVCTINKEI